MLYADLKLAGACATLQTLSLGSPSPPAAFATFALRFEIDGHTWTNGNSNSHFPLLCFAAAENKFEKQKNKKTPFAQCLLQSCKRPSHFFWISVKMPHKKCVYSEECVMEPVGATEQQVVMGSHDALA